MKLTAKFGEQEMKLQAKFGSSQTKVPSSVGSVTFVGGSGGGKVQTVNGISPDENGNIDIPVGATSWNELEDKPFEYIPPIADIQWDGVIGDKFAIDLTPFGYQNMYFVKVSDEVFTAEELVGATFTTASGDMCGINEDSIDKSTFPGLLVANNVISVCYSADDFNAAIGAPSGYVTNGTYFLYQAGVSYVSRLVLPAVRILWDGNLDGRPVIDLGNGEYLCKVSDDVYSKEQIIASVLSISDDFFSYVVTEDLFFSVPGFYGTPDAFFIYSENDANSTFGLPQGTITNGVWFFKNIYEDSEVFYTTAFSPNTLKTIDEKFIPDTIARKSDIPETPSKLSQLENDAGFITADDIPEAPDSTVQTVNGVAPDENGNVEIEVGAKSWNDLEDKPFGGDIIRKSFVDAVNIQFINGTESIATSHTIGTAIKKAGGLIEGKTYEVSISGKSYECICVRVPVYSMTGGTMYVNELHSVGEHGVSVKYSGTMLKYYTEAPVADGPHSVEIFELDNTLKTIDEKYIPDTIARKNDSGFVFVGTASVGQGVVVKSVENGKPSEFEAVDLVKSYNDLTDVPVKETRTEVMDKHVFVGTKVGYSNLFVNQYNLVVFDDVEYKVQVDAVGFSYSCGNPHLLNAGGLDNGMPFYIYSNMMERETEIYASTTGTHTISAYKRELKFLSEDLLPESVVLESELTEKGYQNESQVKALINNSKSEIVNDVIASLPIYNGEVEKV